MELTLLTILLGLLAIVVFQDFKNRSISWFLIPLLFIAFSGSALLKIETQEFITYSGINLTIIVLNLIGITLFVWLKEKKLKNIVDTYLGLGDILFFLVLTTVFSPLNFIVFYLGSIMLITIIYGCIILFNKQKNTLIPLAGAMSMLLMMVLVADLLIPTFNVYQDIILLNE